MKCPKCGAVEDIKFFLRHQKTSDDDEDTTANCITMLHANPDCGFNESYMLEDCLDIIFPDWSEIQELEDKINEIQNSVNMSDMFAAMADNIIEADSEVIETDGEIVETNELPSNEETGDIDQYF